MCLACCQRYSIRAAFGAGASERLHAVSVKLHCQLWRETGHNFNNLRELLIPDKTQLRMSDSAALTMAATLKEICLRDTDRGMQLKEGIQVTSALFTGTLEMMTALILPMWCKAGDTCLRCPLPAFEMA